MGALQNESSFICGIFPKEKIVTFGAFNKSIWEDLTKRVESVVESKEILFKGGMSG